LTITNREIADTFETVADMLQIKGESIHRVLAYRNAALSIRELGRDIHVIANEGGLENIPSIGETLAAKIQEMLDTGKLEFYEKLAKEIPPGVVEILRVNGVGPKKAVLFWKELGITDMTGLEAAAREGKLRDLSGMGAKSEQKVIEGIEALARQTGRKSLGEALPAAQAILDYVLTLPGVIEGEIAGSIRRGRPTIGDVDLLVASDDAQPIMDAFVAMESVARVLGHGPKKSSVELHNGLQIDLRVLEKARWGTALNYFTGSQAHNIRMRELTLEKKRLSLNEHAFSPVDNQNNIIEDAPKILCATEEEVYATVGLPYIPPELRENTGEIEAAQAGKLPKLITLEDIHADLHMHTTWSDGKLSIREMAEEAQKRGRKFIVITDHSAYSAIANGLSVERILEQQAEVRQVDTDMKPFRVFHGVEMDIRSDGTLDYPDEVLEKLDFVIASLHFSLRQPRAQITERLLNALRNPHVDLIGHPRGQYIDDREPADLDMEAVFEAACASGTALEINANPRRLDLEAQYARRAVELGILLSINTDAHSANNMDLLHYGVITARRGWVEAKSVLNTWPVEQFIEWTQNRGK
jgi:DNA polymerase (family X)